MKNLNNISKVIAPKEYVPRESYHMGRRSPAVKIVTKICSFVTIVQGTFLTFSVVRY